MTDSEYERALKYWLSLPEERQNELLLQGVVAVLKDPQPYRSWAQDNDPCKIENTCVHVMVSDVLAWSARRQGRIMDYTKRLKDRNALYRSTLVRLSAFVHGSTRWLKYAVMKHAIGCEEARFLLSEVVDLRTAFANMEKEPPL